MSSGESGGGDIGGSTAVADASPATIGTETAPASVESATAVAQEAQYTGEQGTLSSAASRAETAAIGSRGWQEMSLSQAPTEASPYIPDYTGPNQQSYDALQGTARVDALERQEQDAAGLARLSRLPERSPDQPPTSERVEAGLEADKPGPSGSAKPHSEVYTMFNPALGQVYIGLVKDAPGARTAQQSLILDYEQRIATYGMTPDTGWGLPALDLSTPDPNEATARAQMLLNYYRDQGMLAQVSTSGQPHPEQNFVQPNWQAQYRARGDKGWEPVTGPVHHYIAPPDFSRMGDTPATEADQRGKTYQTYTMYNERTGQVYAGQTSGLASHSPLQNVADRYMQHVKGPEAMTPERGWQPAVLDKTSADPTAITGRERMLQDYYEEQGMRSPEQKHKGAGDNRAARVIEIAQREFKEPSIPAGGVHRPWHWW